MNPENKIWESVKQSYLKEVESAIRKSGNTTPQEILDDVSSHLDQKFAELSPADQNRENFEKIIHDMGPASDYAELLGDKPIVPGAQTGIWHRFIINAALSIFIIAVIIAAAQVLDRIITPYYSRNVAAEPNKPGEFAILTSQTLQGRYMDNINYPFVNDPNVIGNWESVDFVWSPEEFIPGQQHWKEGYYFHWAQFVPNRPYFREGFSMYGLDFLPGGSTNVPWQWTKGLLIKPESKTTSRYFIRQINGEQYMFIEWKTLNYIILHQKPGYYVLKKKNSVDQENDKYRRKAEQIVGLMALKQFDSVEDLFDATMKTALPSSKLADVWAKLEQSGGRFESIQGKSRIERQGSMIVTFVPAKWEHNELDVKIVFDSNNNVSGLWMVAPGPRAK